MKSRWWALLVMWLPTFLVVGWHWWAIDGTFDQLRSFRENCTSWYGGLNPVGFSVFVMVVFSPYLLLALFLWIGLGWVLVAYKKMTIGAVILPIVGFVGAVGLSIPVADSFDSRYEALPGAESCPDAIANVFG